MPPPDILEFEMLLFDSVQEVQDKASEAQMPAPPSLAELPVIVHEESVALLLEKMAPPALVAILFLKVQDVAVKVPEFWIAPP